MGKLIIDFITNVVPRWAPILIKVAPKHGTTYNEKQIKYEMVGKYPLQFSFIIY